MKRRDKGMASLFAADEDKGPDNAQPASEAGSRLETADNGADTAGKQGGEVAKQVAKQAVNSADPVKLGDVAKQAAQQGVDIGADGCKVDHIAEMVGAIFDPIVVYPNTGWEESIPKEMKTELPLHRLVHLMRCLKGLAAWDEASDADALLYMFPLTLAMPVNHDWATIYVYLGTRVLGQRMPEDIAEKSLNRYQAGMLRDLKVWIKRKQLEHRKARRRASSVSPPKKEAVEEKYEQLSMM